MVNFNNINGFKIAMNHIMPWTIEEEKEFYCIIIEIYEKASKLKLY